MGNGDSINTLYAKFKLSLIYLFKLSQQLLQAEIQTNHAGGM